MHNNHFQNISIIQPQSISQHVYKNSIYLPKPPTSTSKQSPENTLYFNNIQKRRNYNLYRSSSEIFDNRILNNQITNIANWQHLKDQIFSPGDEENPTKQNPQRPFNITRYYNRALTPNFIKNSKSVKSYLPYESSNGKKTLILDLDETLVHSAFKPFYFKADLTLNVNVDGINHLVHVLKRPFVDEFLRKMSMHYEIVVFTASISQYANPLLDILDTQHVITHRLFREHCDNSRGLYIKDLRRLGRELKDMIIVDNNPISYAANKENGIPIPTWHYDKTDDELLKLIPILQFLAYVNDVRDYVKEIVNGNQVDFFSVNMIINTKKNEIADIDNNTVINNNIFVYKNNIPLKVSVNKNGNNINLDYNNNPYFNEDGNDNHRRNSVSEILNSTGQFRDNIQEHNNINEKIHLRTNRSHSNFSVFFPYKKNFYTEFTNNNNKYKNDEDLRTVIDNFNRYSYKSKFSYTPKLENRNINNENEKSLTQIKITNNYTEKDLNIGHENNLSRQFEEINPEMELHKSNINILNKNFSIFIQDNKNKQYNENPSGSDFKNNKMYINSYKDKTIAKPLVNNYIKNTNDITTSSYKPYSLISNYDNIQFERQKTFYNRPYNNQVKSLYYDIDTLSKVNFEKANTINFIPNNKQNNINIINTSSSFINNQIDTTPISRNSKREYRSKFRTVNEFGDTFTIINKQQQPLNLVNTETQNSSIKPIESISNPQKEKNNVIRINLNQNLLSHQNNYFNDKRHNSILSSPYNSTSDSKLYYQNNINIEGDSLLSKLNLHSFENKFNNINKKYHFISSSSVDKPKERQLSPKSKGYIRRKEEYLQERENNLTFGKIIKPQNGNISRNCNLQFRRPFSFQKNKSEDYQYYSSLRNKVNY